MAVQWQPVATFQDWSAAQQAAALVNDQHFVTGDRGAVTVELPGDVSGWLVSTVQSAIDAAGVAQWGPVYAEGTRLVIPFTKQSPTIPVIITVLLGLVIAGVILITVWKLLGAAEALAGPWGLLLAGAALLVVGPMVLGRTREAVYPYPMRNPLDNTTLLQIGGLGLVGAAGFEMAKRGTLPGVLQDMAHSLSPATIPATPPAGATKALPPGTSGGPQPATLACFPFNQGNTRLDFQVTPWNPPRQEGASVTYSGRLMMVPPLVGYATGEQPLSGETIEFWDAGLCRRFDQAVTDSAGYFTHTRPLATDEQDGYRVFARYSGSGWLLRDPYVTGVWAVQPQ